MKQWAADDPGRPFADTAKTIRSRRRTERHQNIRRAEHRTATIADKVEEKFGPNPCQRLTLQNSETGETIHKACDSKRCHDCAPRKRWLLAQQTKALGDTIWVTRHHNYTDITRALERAKKQHQRNGIEYQYTITGDAYLGWIIASTVQIMPEQRWMALKDWLFPILDAYQYGDSRLRRSRILGRMSLVPLRAVVKQGTSMWRTVFKVTPETESSKIRRQIANIENMETTCNITKGPESLVGALPDPY